ncbi:MAG: capsid cement protein [Phycisphaerales bacterium]|nr:DUF2190 family protein [Terriglobales bacterium]
MKNKIQDGEVLNLVVGASVVAGDPVVVGGVNGVAATDYDATSTMAAVETQGVFDLSVKAVNDAGNSGVAIGDRIYFVTGDTPKLSKKATGGSLFGIALEAITSGATDTINVLLIAQTEADTGIASAHEADVAQTQTALTDNGGGTADGTVASQAAPVTLTDNTGGSGSHDDTLAAVTAPTLSDWNGSSVYPSAAQGTAITDAVNALKQNQSDVGQKVIELVTLAGTQQNNMKEVTTELALVKTDVANLVTKMNAVLLALEKFQVLASS